MNKDIRLILLDMDGTLCDNDGHISLAFFDVVKKLNQQGLLVGIATGRPYYQLPFDNPEELICICQNGAIIYQNGEVIDKHIFDQKIARKLLDIGLNIPHSYAQIFTSDKVYSNLTDQKTINHLQDIHFDFTYQDNLYPYLNDALNISFLSFNGEDTKKYFDQKSLEYQLLPSGYGCLDITPYGITKYFGALHLCELLNISIHQVMAIGDQENDLELIKHAGLGVAMKNAVQSVKDIADMMTALDNHQHGCIDFLERYFQL